MTMQHPDDERDPLEHYEAVTFADSEPRVLDSDPEAADTPTDVRCQTDRKESMS